MDKNTKQYNLRQVNLIQHKIEFYIFNKLSLGELITDLEALADCIKEHPIEGFGSAWFCLEEVFADTRCDNRNYHSFEETALVSRGLIGILRSIDAYKKEYLADVQEDEGDLA